MFPATRRCREGTPCCSETLLLDGADVSVRNNDRLSALDFAAIGGRVDVIRELLQHGTAVMLHSSFSGLTALHNAACFGQGGAVDVLLIVEAGADVEARAAIGAPLHYAAFNGRCSAILALLRHKADVNAWHSLGRSPFTQTCMKLHQDAADLLLRWGVDETTSVDSEGKPVFHFIGEFIEEDDRHTRADDMESSRSLLARPPAGRPWRRRGLLLLCRAFLGKARL